MKVIAGPASEIHPLVQPVGQVVFNQSADRRQVRVERVKSLPESLERELAVQIELAEDPLVLDQC